MAHKNTQWQQVNNQIFDANRNLGKVRPKNAKYFDKTLTTESSDPTIDDDITYWRKRWFVSQRPTQYYTPKETDFISYIASGNDFSTNYLSSTSGGFNDTQILQYTVACYDIEVFRNSQATLRFDLSTNKSVAIQVNNVVVYDSGDGAPNTRKTIDINIPARIWTKIEIYFYTDSSRIDENRITFSPQLVETRAFDKTRTPVPEPPNAITATAINGSTIEVTWSVLDQSIYEFFQLFYGTDANASTMLASAIRGDLVPLRYVNTGLEPSTTYYYKVRGITSEGETTTFSSIESATTEAIIENFNTLEWEFLNNSTVGIPNYYSSQDTTVSGVLTARNGPLADSGNISCVATGYEGYGITGTLTSVNLNKYYFEFDLSGFQDGLINVIAEYTDSGYTIPTITGQIVYDNASPLYSFVLDADSYFADNNEDSWTRSTSVYLFETLGNDPNDYATTGLGGLRSTAGLYQIRAGETPASMSGNDWLPYLGSWPYTLTTATGLKTIYAEARDRAGNVSLIASDTIYYATGEIEPISVNYVSSSYSFLDVKWQKPSRNDIQGYDLWYTLDGQDPDNSASPNYITRILEPLTTSYRHYWNGIDIDGKLIFPLQLGDAVVDQDYYYWLKGFTYDGQLSGNYSASGLIGQLSNLGPYDDTLATPATTGVVDGTIRVRFQSDANYPNTDYNEGNAFYHDIYRLDISENPGSINTLNDTVWLRTVNANEEDANGKFYVYDTPPYSSHFYQYFSVARNFWNYAQTGTTVVPVDSGLRLNDGPPSTPVWDTGQFLAKWWGIKTAITDPTETDIVSYQIYVASGDQTGTADPTGLSEYNTVTFNYDSIGDPDQPTYIFQRETLSYPTGLNTFWVKAIDDAGLISDYSTPVATGIQISQPPTPVWVSGECYPWYGYNHLVGSGNVYSDGLLQGYRIYRSTGTTFSAAINVGSILNNNSDGQKVFYDDHDANPFTIYYYWLTAFNTLDVESSPSAMLTLSGTVQPNYGEFFGNTLDNSSFERPLDSDNNWAVTDAGTQIVTSESKFGETSILVRAESNYKLAYSGYIFCQPSEDYLFSMYVKPDTTSSARSIRVSGIWYSGDRETEVGRFGTVWLNDILTLNNWTRVTGDIFTAPVGATNAYLEIYGNNTLNDWYVDGCQWESYVSGTSPVPYRDSRAINTDRISAHVVEGDQLKFNSIKGNKLEAETISGREILAGSITAEKLAVIPGLAVPDFSFDLITSGQHTIYVEGGTIYNYGSSYDITSVAATDGGNDTALGLLFSTTDDNTDPYYAYYDNTLASGVLNFTRSLATALTGDFIVWKFTNTLETVDSTDDRQNAGFFVFNGSYAGPGIQIEGNQITAGNINGIFIQAGTLTADKMVVGGLVNLIQNGSFELTEFNSFTGLTIDGVPASRAAAHWQFNDASRNSDDYSGSTLPCGVIATGIGEVLYDTTETIDNGYNVAFIKTEALVDRYITTNKFRMVPTVNYRLTFKYLISQSNNDGISLYPGIMCYDGDDDPLRGATALISGGSYYQPSSSAIPNVNYINDITSSASNRNSWVTTGYDIRITSGNVNTVKVAFYVDGQAATPSPYFYIDEVQLKVGSVDTDYEDNAFIADGFSLVSDSIYTRHIAAEQITATEIAAAAITAEKIDAGAVTAEKLTIRSANLLRGSYFDRWGGTQRYRSGTTDYGSDNDSLVDGWMARLAVSESTQFGYYKDTDNYKFNSSSLMISGLVHSGSNAYLDSAVDPIDGNRYIKLEPSTEYTFGYWIYKYSSSSDINVTGFVETFDSGGTTIAQHRADSSFTSADDDTWSFITHTFTTASNVYDARVLITPARGTYATPFKISLDGVVLVKGSEVDSGFYGEGSSIFNGNYLKVGTIDVDQVGLRSDTSSVSINASGIIVGTPGAERSELNNANITFYDSDNRQYKYLKRIEYIEDLEVETPYIFSIPFNNTPSIALVPQSINTYNPSFSSNHQYLTLISESVSSGGFTPNAYISTGTVSVNGIDSGDLDFNDSTLYYDIGWPPPIIVGTTTPISENMYFANTPNHMGNKLKIDYNVTITGSNLGLGQREDIIVQCLYGRVSASNLVISGAFQTYWPIFWGNTTDLQFAGTISNDLPSNFDWAFIFRVGQYTNYNGGGQAFWGSTDFYSATYLELPSNSVTASGTVSAIVIDRD